VSGDGLPAGGSAGREEESTPSTVKPTGFTLITAMQVREWRMRKAATEVLGKIGDPRAVVPLIAALSDEDKEIRKSVV
jgi:HEAT repeat protein